MEHRKRFKAGIERLENRELMAGDLNFDPQTGALSIIGTRAGDQVGVLVVGPNDMTVSLNASSIHVNPSSVRSIFMNLGAGNDRVNFDHIFRTALNPEIVDIQLGSGVRDEVSLTLSSAIRINVDARASRGSRISIATSVTDRVIVDMGTDSGADTLSILGSDINRLDARMGGGDDVVEILASSIQRANLLLGSGDDRVISKGTDGHIASGTLDGGVGQDTIDPQYKNRGRKFERTWSW